MRRSAHEIADALEEAAELLAIAGESVYRVRAYERGAQAVRELGTELEKRLDEGTLIEVPGLGRSLVASVEELSRGGELKGIAELRQKYPPGVLELSRIGGVGIRRARKLDEELGIRTVEDLEAAARSDRLLDVKGFGAKTQAKILESLAQLAVRRGRCRIDEGVALAQSFIQMLRALSPVVDAAEAGALRRCVEVLDCIDVVACALDPAAVIDALLRRESLRNVRRVSSTFIEYQTSSDVRGTLRVVLPEDQAVALLVATGSEVHLRRLAERNGEVELTPGGARRGGERVPFSDEAAVYDAFGLPWIPPELREDGSEVDLALAGRLPRLVELADLAGALHNHTLRSDGNATAREMQEAAGELGLRYLGISDHSKSAHYARGLSDENLLDQAREIADARALGGAELLHGVESDILEDGSLDHPPEILEQLDFIVSSIHARHHHDAEQMTRRLVRAAQNRFTDVIGHPTGRLLLTREAYQFDHEALIEACRKSGCAIELNANPHRLDFPVDGLRRCRDESVAVCINADAHATGELRNLKWGIMMARRAGLTRADVLNTRPLDELRAWIAERRAD